MTQCRLIRRQSITAGMLTSSVAETGAEYSAMQTYAEGDTAIATAADGLKHTYESLLDGNVGNALSDETRWLDLGATNRWAMFDDVNGTQTSDTSNIDVTIACDGRIDTLALLNLDATSVHVTITAPGVGTVYDQTISLVETAYITDWYSYFTEALTYRSELVLTDLPAYADATVRVQIIKASGTRACGVMVIGLARSLGGTLYGASVGIRDYSKKVTDDFGATALVERAYAKTGNFRLVTAAGQADANAQLLADYRARPTMWIGTDQFASTWIFGWVRDWSTEFVFQGKNYVNLQIEGLI